MTLGDGILSRIKEVPMLSPSALRLMEVVGDTNHTVTDVVRIVECDTVLTAHVLKKINSVATGLVNPIETVDRAVAYLGDKMIVSLAIDCCAPQVFGSGLDGYEGGRGLLWAHSLKTAMASRAAAIKVQTGDNPDVAFTSGILHDIGKFIVSDFMTGSAFKIVHEINPEGLPDYLDGEREALGTDHCVIGGALARHWGLPAVLRSTIEHHHDPNRADPEHVTMAMLVQLGDLIAMVTEPELGFERLSKYLEGQEDLNDLVSNLNLAKLIEEVGKEFQNTRNVLFEDATEATKP